MTNITPPPGFLAIDLHYFGSADAWRRKVEAVRVWQNAAINRRADVRDRLALAYYSRNRASRLVGHNRYPETYDYQVRVANETKALHLSPPEREALDSLSRTKVELIQSARERAERGEIKIAFLPLRPIDAAWKLLEPDRVQRFPSTTNGRAFVDGAYHFVAFRELGGLPIDQAVHVYGDPDDAKEMAGLEMIGAPDLIGRTQGLMPAIEARALEAPARYHLLQARQNGKLLNLLRAGELVGVDGGAVLPLAFWAGVDPGSDLAAWRPGALIRPPKDGELFASGDGRYGGRPTAREFILAEIKKNHLTPEGKIKGFPSKVEAARQLLKWKNKHYPGLEPDDAETIAGYLKGYDLERPASPAKK